MELTKEESKTNCYTAVIRWFVTITLCVLVQLLFIFISDYFTSFSRSIIGLGGWISCMVCYTRVYNVINNK